MGEQFWARRRGALYTTALKWSCSLVICKPQMPSDSPLQSGLTEKKCLSLGEVVHTSNAST